MASTTDLELDDLLDGNHLALPPGDVPRAALALARRLEPDYLLHHSVRSWVLARVVAASRGWCAGRDFDDELLFVACVLHDTGLHVPSTRDRRFEVESADVARSFVIDRGLSSRAADTVWDAVALHTSVGIAEHMRAEVALTRLGVAMDFGQGAEVVPDRLVAALDRELPRLDLARRIVDAIVEHAGDSASRAPEPSVPGLLVQQRRRPPHVTWMERGAARGRWGS